MFTYVLVLILCVMLLSQINNNYFNPKQFKNNSSQVHGMSHQKLEINSSLCKKFKHTF